MKFMVLMVVEVLRCYCVVSETPYHYISQVPETTPQTLSPKPLFSPHDTRREGNGRQGVYGYQGTSGYGYGTKQVGGTGKPNTRNLVLTDNTGYVTSGQEFWYPVYTDIHYPDWISLSQTPYAFSYGVLPEGYEPVIPVAGSPTGYSFSYQANDHNRQEASDGRGNYYSSFSFVPPAPSNVGLQPHSASPALAGIPPLDHRVFSTTITPTVNIPARRFNSYPEYPSTSKPVYIPSPSSRPFDVPTARPLVDFHPEPTYNDFVNGYNFESKKLFTTRLPQKSFNVNSHALNTNIQYDSTVGESTSKSSSGERRVTIEPSVSPQASTERSYQSLSRSLPLAFTSPRFSTGTSPPPPFISTEKPAQDFLRIAPSGSRSSPEIQRSATRRSTTENYDGYRSLRRSTTSLPLSSSKKSSVIQKIPRKLKPSNDTSGYEAPRPPFIDDLTSLAYSSNDVSKMNNTIIQFKQSSVASSNEKTATNKKSSLPNDYSKDFNTTSDNISKDGYITGNKTHLGGLGLRTNIYY